MNSKIRAILGGAVLTAVAATAHAGTYANISIDGNFEDWASVPVAATGAVNSSLIDITQLKVANDSTNLYILLTFNGAMNPQAGDGVFTAVDSDNNTSTGYNVFGQGLIGSNFSFQNDFPFEQTATLFNSSLAAGQGGTGTEVGASYSASPYNTATVQQEIAIPLATTEADADPGGYTGLVFPATGFGLEFYNDNGAGDLIGPVSYTLAAVPEPASLSLLVLGALPLVRRRRA